MSQQKLYGQIGIEAARSTPLFWFSNAIGFFWLQFSEPLGLIGVRIGGVLAYIISGCLIFSALKNTFASNKEQYKYLPLVIVIATLFACNSLPTGALIIPDYYTIPLLLSSVFLNLYSNALHGVHDEKTVGLLSIAIGLTMLGLFFSRITMLFLCLAPIAYKFVLWFFCDVNQTNEKNNLTLRISYLVLTIGILFVLLALYYNSLIDMYWNYRAADDSHGLWSLIKIYKKQILRVLPIVIFLYLLIFLYFVNRAGENILFAFIGTIALLSTLSALDMVSYSFYFKKYSPIYIFPFMLLFLSLLLISTCLYLNYRKNPLVWHQKKAKYGFFLVLSCLIPFSLGAGTNTGVFKFAYGMVLPAGFLYVLAVDLVNGSIVTKSKFNILFTALVLILGMIGCYRLYSVLYRDHIEIFSNNVSILKSSGLKGVVTSHRKQASIDNLINYLTKNISETDFVIAYGNMPMIYYLSGIIPYKNESWLDEVARSLLENKVFPEICKNKNTWVILKSKANTMNSDWDVPRVTTNSYKYIDEYIMGNCMTNKVYADSYFEVYKTINATA